MFDLLCALFRYYVKRENLPEDGDAMELLMSYDLTPSQRLWLSDFVDTWELAEKRIPDFYGAY